MTRLLCALSLHLWRSWGGETVRDLRGKIRIQWQFCMRGCGAGRVRTKMFTAEDGRQRMMGR